MKKQFFKDVFMWGLVLWFIGYIFGILLYPLVPQSMIGWIIMPIGLILTLWVLLYKVKKGTFHRYVWVAVVWALVAVICDYFFLFKVFKPADGYYKPDVYLYYVLTFILPLLVGWKKSLS